MAPWMRALVAGVLPALLPMLAFGLCGCLSEDPNVWYNKTVLENFASRSEPPASPNAAQESGPVAAAAVPQATVASAAPVAPISVGRSGAIPESELYQSEMSCGGIALGSGRPASLPSGTISLDMTECDVARRAGAPDKIEMSTGARGERLLVMTYARGERPRIYRFAAGRLAGIEAFAPARTRPLR